MFSANENQALNAIIGAAFGGTSVIVSTTSRTYHEIIAAGQRCMAISVGKSLACYTICSSGEMTIMTFSVSCARWISSVLVAGVDKTRQGPQR
jgi:hypothetical protein